MDNNNSCNETVLWKPTMSKPSIVQEGSTVLNIDDIQLSFDNNVITLQLINGEDHVEYSVDFTMIKQMYKPGVVGISDDVPSQVCAAIECAWAECKAMLLRGYK